MERREFMFKAVAGASTVAILLGYSCQALEYDHLLAEPQLLSTIWPAEAIAKIGKRYQKLHPEENTKASLIKALTESISTKDATLSASMDWRIKEDFQTGKTLSIDGWILSITEARQCALFSLLQPS